MIIRKSFFLLAFLLFATAYCRGQSFDYVENAVYIYNFVKYTSWPHKQSTINVGVVGATPVEDELKKLFARKTSTSVIYSVRRIQAAEAATVDVVIIAKNAADQLRTISQSTANSPILVISEKENMCRLGACISFYIDEDNDFKTGYQLSVRNCASRQLTVSAQILENAVLTR